MHQGKKLKEYLRAKEFDLKELAPKLGIKRQYFYSKYFAQETLDADFLDKVSRVTGFALSDVTGMTQQSGIGNIKYVPIQVQAGFLTDYKETVFEKQLQSYSVPGIHGQYYDMEVRDYSMHDLVSPGDRVFGTKVEDPLKELLVGNIYIIQDIEGMVLKIFHSINDTTALFKSYNNDYPDIKRPLKSVKALYRVDYILSDVKRKNFLQAEKVKAILEGNNKLDTIKDKLLEVFLRKHGMPETEIKNLITSK